MGYSAYFVKSTPPRFLFCISFNTLQLSFRHIEDVYEDFLKKKKKKKKYSVKNIDKLQLYEEV